MTSPTTQQRVRAEEFVKAVSRKIEESNGDRAALRRSLGRAPHDPMSLQAHSIVGRHLSDHEYPATERAYYAVAAMIAAQPRRSRDASRAAAAEQEQAEQPPERPTKSLGVTLAEAAANGKLKADTTEARLMLLCRQNLDGIHRHLPRLISQLSADIITIDWVTLLDDLRRWGFQPDLVAKRWLQDYYRTYHRNMAAKRAAADKDESEPQ